MASNTLVKRLLWVYSIFTLYLIVGSLLGVAGVVYLTLRLDMPPCLWARRISLSFRCFVLDGNSPTHHSETPEKTSTSDQTVVSDTHRPDLIGSNRYRELQTWYP